MSEHFDAVVVGTGFASSMFLHRFLKVGKRRRILVLERGPRREHSERLARRLDKDTTTGDSYDGRESVKPWGFTLEFGGSSNCWWACTPRMFPDDFEIHSRYGVGSDWPLSYSELEPFYTEVEDLMQVAGPSDSPFPRSRPYPQPPHALSSVDQVLKRAYPEHFFNQPTARPTRSAGRRPACCNNGVCTLCPIDSKFTISNSMADLYRTNGLRLELGSEVQTVQVEAGVAKGVNYLHEGKEHFVHTDLVILGANAIFNPFLLLKSGIPEGPVGKGLVEQVSLNARVYLGGLENLDGSTSITGHGYNFYSGPHRARRAAAMIESWNVPKLRMRRGKWRQVVELKFVFEDLRSPENAVTFRPQSPEKPYLVHKGISKYARAGLDAVQADLANFVSVLPVEHIDIKDLNPTESHILGTTVMGSDPKTSVVDRDLVHHRVRNLLLLGSGAFPTAAPANPTLTLSALSLRAASKLA